VEITRRSISFGEIDIFGTTISPTIHWYGVIIVTGILLAAITVAYLTRRDKDDPDHVWNGLMWVVIAGVIGARLWSVLFPAGDAARGELSLDYLLDINDGPLAIWSGGLSIFGAVLGGFIGLVLYARGNDLRMSIWADRAVISLPLAQAIGRWGNWVNEELYGEPTDLPWAITIDNPVAPYEPGTTFHPLFLYESLLNFLLFGVLFYLYTRRRKGFMRWDFVLMYTLGYAVIRFLLEFIRIEVPLVNGVNVSQVTTAVMFIISVSLLVARHYADRFTTPRYASLGKRMKSEVSANA
jgi:phosphatidylglycerol:prolipoprotein diacylglycerol transferase